MSAYGSSSEDQLIRERQGLLLEGLTVDDLARIVEASFAEGSRRRWLREELRREALGEYRRRIQPRLRLVMISEWARMLQALVDAAMAASALVLASTCSSGSQQEW